MSTILDRARNALADLPEKDQIELVDQLVQAAAVRRLKALIDEGHAALARGEVEPFDIESIVKEAHAKHAAGT